MIRKLNEIFNENVLRNGNFRNSFFLLIGTSIFKIAILALNFILAYILSADGFGDFSLIKSTSTTFTSILIYLINMSVSQSIAQQFKNDSLNESIYNARIFSYLVVFSGLIILLVFKNPLMEYLFNSQITNFDYLLIIALYTVSLIAGSEIGIIIGIKKSDILAKSNLYTLLTLPIIVLLTIKFQIYGAILGLILMYFTQIVILKFFVNKATKLTQNHFKFNIKKIRISSYIRSSLPLLFITFITALPFYFVKVNLYIHEGPAKLGLFELAYQWFVLSITISNTILLAVIPAIGQLSTEIGSFEKIGVLKKKYLKLILIISLLLFVFGLSSAILMEMFYGTKYEGLTTIVGFLMTATIPYTLFLLNEKIMIGQKMFWKTFFTHFLFAFLFLTFIFFFGITINTISWGLILGYIGSFCFSFLILQKRLESQSKITELKKIK